MSIREQMAKGNFETEKPKLLVEPVAWEVPEDNPFSLKLKERLDRMCKSTRARTKRKQLRDIKQNRWHTGLSC